MTAARSGYEANPIQFFCDDGDLLKKNTKGRRLFFANEPYKGAQSSLTNRSISRVEIPPRAVPKNAEGKTKNVYDQDVSQITDGQGQPIARSKTLFDQHAIDKVEGFGKVDFDHFQGIFNIIEPITSKNGTQQIGPVGPR